MNEVPIQYPYSVSKSVSRHADDSPRPFVEPMNRFLMTPLICTLNLIALFKLRMTDNAQTINSKIKMIDRVHNKMVQT